MTQEEWEKGGGAKSKKVTSAVGCLLERGAMYRLAKVLQNGAEGVAADIARAIALYESALRENATVWAMNGLLWTLLHRVDDCGNVDKSKAMETLRGAVDEKNDVNGMVALSVLYARQLERDWS
ncbi:Sel1-repeat containing protein [Gracilaria domingensis]|nr:Sel1-repeat containing protein [Gracilaria domingensis]